MGPTTSCSAAPCVVYTPNAADFSPKEVLHLQNGIDRFNAFVGARRFNLGANGCAIRKELSPLIYRDGGFVPEWDGQHHRWLREIWISSNWIDPEAYEYLESVFMHELGHSAGMSHIPNDQEGVMNSGALWGTGPAKDWTWADRNECEISGVCAASHRFR